MDRAQAAEEAAGIHLKIDYQHVFHDGSSDVAADGLIVLPDVSLGVAVLRAGYEVEEHVVIEGEAMLGLSDGTGTISSPEGDIPFEIGIEYGFAVFGKAWYPAFEGRIVHARLGVAAACISPRFSPGVSTMRLISPLMASAASSRSRGAGQRLGKPLHLAPVDDGDVGIDVRELGRKDSQPLVELVLAGL